MNLFPTEEQQQLRESVGRFLKDRGNPQAAAAHGGAVDEGLWRELAALGVLAIAIPEAYGGLDRGFEDVAYLMEEVGESSVSLPLMTTLICTQIIAAAGNEDQRRFWLSAVGRGEARLALAHLETGRRFDARATTVTAAEGDGGWVLQGHKRLVADFSSAHHVVVSACAAKEPARQMLFILPVGAPGLEAATYQTLDKRSAADLAFNSVRVPADALLQGSDEPFEALLGAMDDAVIASSFEAIGMMRALLRRTVDHAKTRRQFGRPLSDNQALQHRLADMAVQLEEASAIALRALLGRADGPSQRAYSVSSAKLKVSRAGRVVYEGAIQIHGAMGMTEELDVGARAKRLLGIELSFGTPAEHQARLVSLRSQGAIPCASSLGEPS